MIRCTAMKGKVRCCLTQGHSGWHHDGAWLEWLADDEREALYRADPCRASVAVDATIIECSLPANHQTAHNGGGMVWIDPVTIPEKAWPPPMRGEVHDRDLPQ